VSGRRCELDMSKNDYQAKTRQLWISDSALGPVLPLVGQFEYTPRWYIIILPTESTLRRLFMAIIYDHDVIHKTGST